ncbi:MAG: hypothetical protein RLN72_16000 [Henriciella sp.]
MTIRVRTQAAAAALATLLAAGCASSSVATYAAQGSDTARLRIAIAKGAVPQSGAGDGMNAFLHTSEDCLAPQVLGAVYTIDSDASRHDATRRSHQKAGKLDMPLGEYDSLEVEEVLVDAGAGQDIALQFSVLLGGPLGAFTRCNIALEQDFEAGRDYEIVGRFDTPQTCSAVVNELVVDADGAASRVQLNSVSNATHPQNPACFVKY